jgi:hypothetical protein
LRRQWWQSLFDFLCINHGLGMEEKEGDNGNSAHDLAAREAVGVQAVARGIGG